MIFVVVLFVVVASFVSSKELAGVVKPPRGWIKVKEEAIDAKRVKLSIALVAKDYEKLEKSLLEISTPGSPKFRKYLKKHEIADIVGRSDADISMATNWLKEGGARIDSIHPHRDWIFATATVTQIERLFSCKLIMYTNVKTGSLKIGLFFVFFFFYIENIKYK
jgi:tripeptidyl-peptidase-1